MWGVRFPPPQHHQQKTPFPGVFCYNKPMEPKTIYTILHLLGVVIGMGGAFMGDIFYFKSIRDKKLTKTELSFLQTASAVTWAGLTLLVLSGALLYSLNPAGYLASSKFITKMVIVGIIILNGILFHTVHLRTIKAHLNINLTKSKSFKKKSSFLYTSGAISVTSWISALVLGALHDIPLTVGEALTLYGGVVVLGIIAAKIWKKKTIG